MNSPFGLSFVEIMAQANANMMADKGVTAPPEAPAQAAPAQAAPAQAAPAQAAPAQAAQTGNKSFLEMVEDAQKSKNNGEAKKPEAVTESAPNAGLSFDDLMKQAGAPTAPAQEAVQPTSGTPVAMSFEDMMNQATAATSGAVKESVPAADTAPSTGGMSFEDMMNQAQAAAASPSFDDMFKAAGGVETKEPVKESGQGPFTQNNVGQTDFDDLMKQAEKLAEESKAPAAEAPVTEETPAEVPAAEAPVTEETPAEAPVTEAPVTEEIPAEAPVKEPKAKKGRGSKKAKADPEPEEIKEPLPDMTQEYEVDLTGGAGKSEPETKTSEDAHPGITDAQPGTMERLFTEEEMAELRTDIRAFVRREFKAAMVGVVKDLLAEFKDE